MDSVRLWNPALSLLPWLFCEPSFSADPLPNNFLARVFSSEPLEADCPNDTPDALGVPEAADSEDALVFDSGAGSPSLPVIVLNEAERAWDGVRP